VSQTRCQTLLCHDIVKSAPAYSLLAGTLAAVAFLAIIFLLEHSRRGAADLAPVVGLENAAVSLVSAFLNLIIATFLYAALSGEESLTPRAATLGLVAAVGISIAFLNLLYGVVWLFEAWELKIAASVTGTIAGLVAPCVTFAFIGLRALDMLAVGKGSHADRTWLAWLLGGLVGGLGASFFLSRSTPFGQATRRLGVKLFALSAVALGVLTVVGAAVVSQLHTSYYLPSWGAAWLLVAVFAVFATFAHLIRAIEQQCRA
jgi:hypothetical protein